MDAGVRVITSNLQQVLDQSERVLPLYTVRAQLTIRT